MVLQRSQDEADAANQRQLLGAALCGVSHAEQEQKYEKHAADIEYGRQRGRDCRVDAAEEDIEECDENARDQRVSHGDDHEGQSLICVKARVMGAAGEDEGDEHQKPKVGKRGNDVMLISILPVEIRGVIAVGDFKRAPT